MTPARKPITLSKISFAFGTVAVFLLGLAAGTLLHWTAPKTVGVSFSHSRSQATTLQSSAPQSKPWGDFVYTSLALKLPEEFFPQLPSAAGSLKWFFAVPNRAALTDQMNLWILGESHKATLADTNHWTDAANGVYVAISPHLVLELSPAERQQVYPVLALSELNVNHRYPFRFPLHGLDDRFRRSTLTVDKLQIVKDLTYTNSGTLCFADLETLRHVFSVADMRKLLQTLYETPTFLMKLRLDPHPDIDQLCKYWGGPDKGRTIKPFLDALAQVPEESEISVSFLLPPLPRLLLYTFPSQAHGPAKLRRDCFWTALNFFNEQPDDRFLDGQYLRQVLESDYQPIQSAPQYGDLLAILNPDKTIMHLCVYIADDVVFTKNGVGELQPWVLMKITDLKMKYASFGNFGLTILRKKTSAQD